MEDILKFMDIICKVKLNRNDTEQQIFTKYFNSINQNLLKEYLNSRPEEGKNIELSKKYRMKGNAHYEENNYAEAMVWYTASLALAPRENVEYGLTIANRSAVLYDLKRYKECLVDIERVCKSEYPKHLLYKIFIRQANCYLELKCYGKAMKAVQNAKSSYATAKVLLKKELSEVILEKIKVIEKSLENHSDTDKTVDDDQEQSSLPELTAGENPCFAYASNTVSMRKNKQRGRHVVASVDIKEGDVLFVEPPYSTCMYMFKNTYLTYCSHCFTSSLTCVPCTSCHMLLFCTDHCRQQYWDSKHRWECAAVRKSIISAELSLALGVLFRASRTGFNTTIADGKIYGNKLDNFPYVNQLMTHKNNIPEYIYTEYVKSAVWLVVYLIHCTDYFDWLYAQHNRPHGSLDELHCMVGGLLLKSLSQNDTNKEVIQNTCVARTDRFGIGLKRNKLTCALYVSSRALNHACLPNAVTSYHGCVKVVRAITDIKKGTEITQCYLKDPDLYQPAARRQELLDEYYFTCTCSACVDGGHALFPWLCTQCRGPAFTTKSNDQIAKCIKCQHTFVLDKYIQQKDMTALYMGMHSFTKDIDILQQAVATMKQIYHETNWNLSLGYTQFVYQYDARGDFKSSLKYVQLLVDLFKITYKYSASEEIVKMLLKYSMTMVQYCLSLKYKKPGLYKKYLKLTKEVINNTTELLTYHMCQKLAVNYQQNMLRLLDVGDGDFDKAIRLFHYNAIHTQKILKEIKEAINNSTECVIGCRQY